MRSMKGPISICTAFVFRRPARRARKAQLVGPFSIGPVIASQSISIDSVSTLIAVVVVAAAAAVSAICDFQGTETRMEMCAENCLT